MLVVVKLVGLLLNKGWFAIWLTYINFYGVFENGDLFFYDFCCEDGDGDWSEEDWYLLKSILYDSAFLAKASNSLNEAAE